MNKYLFLCLFDGDLFLSLLFMIPSLHSFLFFLLFSLFLSLFWSDIVIPLIPIFQLKFHCHYHFVLLLVFRNNVIYGYKDNSSSFHFHCYFVLDYYCYILFLFFFFSFLFLITISLLVFSFSSFISQVALGLANK
jgi:hypothetical protein